jgi:hypothetical protein
VPHELRSRPKDASVDTPDDYTINVEVQRDSLWLSGRQGGAEESGSHPSQRIQTLGIFSMCKTENVLCEAGTNTNGNERRKHDEEWNKNIDELKPLYQITNDKPVHLRRLCNETRITKTLRHTSGRTNEIFCAEFQGLVNKKYNDHTMIYTDGSKKEEKVGYAIVADRQSPRRRIRSKQVRNKKPSLVQYTSFRQRGSEDLYLFICQRT